MTKQTLNSFLNSYNDLHDKSLDELIAIVEDSGCKVIENPHWVIHEKGLGLYEQTSDGNYRITIPTSKNDYDIKHNRSILMRKFYYFLMDNERKPNTISTIDKLNLSDTHLKKVFEAKKFVYNRILSLDVLITYYEGLMAYVQKNDIEIHFPQTLLALSDKLRVPTDMIEMKLMEHLKNNYQS